MSGYRRCKETLDKLHTFLDRELSDSDLEVVRFHLDQCPPCQHVFRFEEHLRRLVKVHCCKDSAPASLREQILARMRSRTS
jgi:mycothiol system anti-sigma-R factor